MSGNEKQELTLDDVKKALDKAKRKGAEAAEVKYRELRKKKAQRRGLIGPCGGALIAIRLDGRTRLGRLLKLASAQKSYFSFCGRNRNGMPTVGIYNMHHHQQQEVATAAATAALSVLYEELNIVGRVDSYYT